MQKIGGNIIIQISRLLKFLRIFQFWCITLSHHIWPFPYELKWFIQKNYGGCGYVVWLSMHNQCTLLSFAAEDFQSKLIILNIWRIKHSKCPNLFEQQISSKYKLTQLESSGKSCLLILLIQADSYRFIADTKEWKVALILTKLSIDIQNSIQFDESDYR